MEWLWESELLFYGGLLCMVVVAVLLVICVVVFTFTGRRLKRKLEKEYGKPLQG